MGGWMSYQRMRSRNGLLFRKPAEDWDPYWRGPDDAGLTALRPNADLEYRFAYEKGNATLIGDLNRMERDYLNDEPCLTQTARGVPDPGPSAQVAEATGVPIEDVKRVLRYVFLEQR